MKLTTFWVVRDPSPVSTVRDICWRSDVANYTRFVIGTHAMGKDILRENVAFYAEDAESEAYQDAIARLAKIRATVP